MLSFLGADTDCSEPSHARSFRCRDVLRADLPVGLTCQKVLDAQIAAEVEKWKVTFMGLAGPQTLLRKREEYVGVPHVREAPGKHTSGKWTLVATARGVDLTLGLWLAGEGCQGTPVARSRWAAGVWAADSACCPTPR